jgi:tripartite-type tricarboxylate transporter receptor subunit TctC
MKGTNKGVDTPSITRRTICKGLATTALAAPFVSLPLARAVAQSRYPVRPVRFILPFGAGGVADTTSRLAAEKLGEKLGQRFVVENQPGAGGINAVRSVISASPDGHTLGLVTNGTAISVTLVKAFPADPVTDFDFVSMLGTFDLVFATNVDSKYKTLQQVIDEAKKNPGKLNFGTINIGSTQNLGAELFKSTANVDVQVVPYRNSPEIVVATLRNDVDVIVDFYAAVRGQIVDGKLRPLAVSSPQRSPILPNVPTVREAGGGDYEVTSWNGLFAPQGTPRDAIEMLNKAVREVVAVPTVKQQFADVGIDAKASSPDELKARLKSDIDKWAKVIERANIPKQ